MAVEGQPLLQLPEEVASQETGLDVAIADTVPEALTREATAVEPSSFEDPTAQLRNVETFVEGLQDWVRRQADSASREQDLLLAQGKLQELMHEVVRAHEKLEGAGQETLALQRDLALATDRSIVLRAEEQEQKGTVEKSQLIVAARAHLRQCLCRDPAGSLWPLWSTSASDMQEYGPGISLYFGFTVRLSITFCVCTMLLLPLLSLNLAGNGLENIDAGTGEHGVLAWSTLGNLQSNGTINSGPFEIPAADFSFWAGLLDAIAMAVTWGVAFWFGRKTIADAVARERKEVVTPDAYTIYVSGLPRHLGDRHLQYEQLLKDHFEGLLGAELGSAAAKKSVEVISRSEQFRNEPPARSCCWQGDRDSRGRRIGVVSKACEDDATCEVRWPGASSQLLQPVRESLKPQEHAEQAKVP